MGLTIGIVGAAGWLGRAFAEAVVDTGVVPPGQLVASYRSARPEFLPEATWTNDNAMLVERSDVVIVSVRPHDLAALPPAEGRLVISVMAGITLAELARHFKTDRVVRTIPNAAAEVRRSYTPWIASEQASDVDQETTRRILKACGSEDEMSSEAHIDYFSGLTGSGPAFPALLADAMMEDAVSRGIDREVARRSVNALLVGTGRLVEARDECPEDVVRTFLDYRGTTAAAIAAMREAGFSNAVRSGLEAALQKSVAWGRPESPES